MMVHLNEHKTFYLMLSTCMGTLKFTFFRVHQTKGNLVRRQWIDVKFDVMGVLRIYVYIGNSNFRFQRKAKGS